MARLISDIKKEMTDAYISEEIVKTKYELQPGKTFEEQFSKVPLESIVFYIVAVAINTLEKLFGKHKSDVSAELDTRLPHRKQWYRDKVLKFQYPNRALIVDSDKYNNTGLSESDIETLQVVKFCAIEEKESKLLIKVAKGALAARETLSAQEKTALEFYLREVKDAGVLFEVVNQQADKFACTMTIYYNPMLLNPSDKPAEKAIKEYVSNLDFNSEYSNCGLVDYLQAIEGVIIPHLATAKTKRAANEWETCSVKTVAESGYFVVEDSDLSITYTAYETGTVMNSSSGLEIINETGTENGNETSER